MSRQMSTIIITLIMTIFKLCLASYSLKECNLNTKFKCYNGGSCIQLEINTTRLQMEVCNCAPGYTGKQCEQKTTPCSPDACAPNGYCNSRDDTYFCRCKPGFTGINCKEKINNCKSAKCKNGGLCVNGINSYTCDCPWGYSGRYCETQLTCDYDLNLCKNNATCIEDSHSIKCACEEGFMGDDCSFRMDSCHSQPCFFGGKCESVSSDDFKCVCPSGRTGKTCEFSDVCVVEKPCKMNSTCIQVSNEPEVKYVCQCAHGYTGATCDLHINSCHDGKCQNSTSSQTKPASTSLMDTLFPSNTNTNGSFVLVLNLAPNEFQKRKTEIIKEFSKQLGIFMLIKKDANNNEMIYPYEYNTNGKKNTWTKVYFIIMFACIDQNTNNCITDLSSSNEIFTFVNQLKDSSSLPNYVSNITYEAYGVNKIDSFDNNNNGSNKSISNNTATLVVGTVISVLLVIVILLGIMIRQQQIKTLVKAPIWFPPMMSSNEHQHPPRTHTQTATSTHQPWSFQQSLKNMFKRTDSFVYDETLEKPQKFRKIDATHHCRDSSTPLFHTTGSSNSSQLTSSDYLSSPASSSPVDFYPSPPESLPDNHYGASSNLKGPSGLTPLMCAIMSKKFPSNLELVDALLNKGADLNSQTSSDGESALHIAARLGLIDICDRLLNYGADFTLVDNYGRTVLHTATGSNQIKIVKMLIQKLGEKLDVDVKTTDKLGDTCLINACRNNFNDLVKLLISCNASVNTTDNNGQSALHWCAKVNNCQAAILLLENGANINLQDENEKTPLSLAIEELNTNEIVQLLIKYQAFVSAEDDKQLELKQSICKNNLVKQQQQQQQHMLMIKNDTKPPIPSSQTSQPSQQSNKEKINRKRKLNSSETNAQKSQKQKQIETHSPPLQKLETNQELQHQNLTQSVYYPDYTNQYYYGTSQQQQYNQAYQQYDSTSTYKMYNKDDPLNQYSVPSTITTPYYQYSSFDNSNSNSYVAYF